MGLTNKEKIAIILEDSIYKTLYEHLHDDIEYCCKSAIENINKGLKVEKCIDNIRENVQSNLNFYAGKISDDILENEDIKIRYMGD